MSALGATTEQVWSLTTIKTFPCQLFVLGPVIGLEFNSNDCVRVTNDAVTSICRDSLSNIYVSSSPQKASQDIDAFYNFVDMSMN